MQTFSVEDIKAKLNPSQWEAVSTVEGPLLVVAGAGTGKTRVIEYRSLYMMAQGIAPESILLLTFTRKAAREMLDRAAAHDPRCRHIEGGTFHSFAYKMIRTYKKALGLADSVSFIDESDAGDALHLLAARAGYLEDKQRFPRKDTLRSILSMSVNRHEPVREVLAKDYPHFLPLTGRLDDLRRQYAEYKIARNLIDYDDMLIYLKFLLEKEEINARIAARLRYVMVDEFQDTNRLQADIVWLLARRHNNCMAVGDDTQSIYSFRGAYYKNMFTFPQRFQDTRIVKLEYNYRSTQPILDLANAVIEGEKRKYEKALYTMSADGEKPTLAFFKDAYDEAEAAAEKIKDYRDGGIPLSGIGVLYRSNFLSLPLQLALAKRNLPFAVFGGMKFIETAHVKDVLAFLKFHLNKRDELSLARVLMLLEGVGPKTAEKLRDILVTGAAEGAAAAEPALHEAVRSVSLRRSVKRVIELMHSLERSERVEEKVRKVLHFYKPVMKEKFDDYPQREEDLKAFAEIAAGYATLDAFLVDFVTIEPPEKSTIEARRRKDDERPLTLSTVHSAKGLEWEAVFIIGAVDGSIPVSYALDNEEALEEERRLLYVAVTRAKRHLHISMHNEGRNGGLSTFNRLSRFLSEARVMEKLEAQAAWFDEAPETDAYATVRAGREDLYRRLMDYFDTDNDDPDI
ncbi:MAG: ATP-dependent helicase [Deltaproteobacteria bacterium]